MFNSFVVFVFLFSALGMADTRPGIPKDRVFKKYFHFRSDGECRKKDGTKGFNQEYLGDCGKPRQEDIDDEDYLTDFSLKGTVLTGLSFEKRADLENVDFFGTQLYRTSFKESVISGGTSFYSVDGSMADFSKAAFREVAIKESQFSHGQFLETVFDGVIIESSNFSSAVFSGEVDLRRPDRKLVRFINGTKIISSNFSSTKLAGASLEGMEVSQVNFMGADLRFAVIERSIVSNSSFNDADLKGVSFKMSELSMVDFVDTQIDGGIFDLASVKNADFRKSVLHGSFVKSSIPGGNFNQSHIYSSDFQEANLKGARFKNAVIESVSFNEADLSNANFNSSQVSNVDFRGANLSGLIFEGTEFQGVLCDSETKLPELLGCDDGLLRKYEPGPDAPDFPSWEEIWGNQRRYKDGKDRNRFGPPNEARVNIWDDIAERKMAYEMFSAIDPAEYMRDLEERRRRYLGPEYDL